MKLTDEQIKYIQRVADSRSDGAGDIIQHLLVDRQAWKEEAEKKTELWTCPDCAFTFDAIHEDVDGGYSCPHCSVITLHEQLNQAVEEAEKQRKYIGFLQSCCLSREVWEGTIDDFLSSLSQENVGK